VLCSFQYLCLCYDLVVHIIIFTEIVEHKELCVLFILFLLIAYFNTANDELDM